MKGHPDTLSAGGTLIQGESGGESGVPRSIFIQRTGPRLVWFGEQGERYTAVASRRAETTKRDGTLWQMPSGGLRFALDGFQWEVTPFTGTPLTFAGSISGLTARTAQKQGLYRVPEGQRFILTSLNVKQTQLTGVPPEIPLNQVIVRFQILTLQNTQELALAEGTYQTTLVGLLGTESTPQQGTYTFPQPITFAGGAQVAMLFTYDNTTAATYGPYGANYTLSGILVPE